jgi:hypothetical protein
VTIDQAVITRKKAAIGSRLLRAGEDRHGQHMPRMPKPPSPACPIRSDKRRTGLQAHEENSAAVIPARRLAVEAAGVDQEFLHVGV